MGIQDLFDIILTKHPNIITQGVTERCPNQWMKNTRVSPTSVFSPDIQMCVFQNILDHMKHHETWNNFQVEVVFVTWRAFENPPFSVSGMDFFFVPKIHPVKSRRALGTPQRPRWPSPTRSHRHTPPDLNSSLFGKNFRDGTDQN